MKQKFGDREMREGSRESGAEGERGDCKEFPKTVMSTCCCFYGCVLKARNKSAPLAIGWSGSEQQRVQEKNKLG